MPMPPYNGPHSGVHGSEPVRGAVLQHLPVLRLLRYSERRYDIYDRTVEFRR